MCEFFQQKRQIRDNFMIWRKQKAAGEWEACVRCEKRGTEIEVDRVLTGKKPGGIGPPGMASFGGI